MQKLLKHISMLSIGALMVGCSSYQEPVLPEPPEKETEPEKEEVVDPKNENEGKFTPLNITLAERSILILQTELAWKMLQTTLVENNGNDVIISPLCAEIALAMTANGMGAESASKTVEALKAPDLNTLNSIYKNILECMPYTCPTGVYTKFSFANWQNTNMSFNPGYAKTLEDVYGVPTYSCDFSTTDMQSVVNKWSSESTGGLIPNLVNAPFNSNVAMVLCNSLYMDSKWNLPFDPRQTKLEDFKDMKGNKVGQAMMMRHKNLSKIAEFYYEQFEKFKLLKLEFKGLEFDMYIYAPTKACSSLEELISAVQNSSEERRTGKYKSYISPEIAIPKFELGGYYNMNNAIKSIGVDLYSCDYSGISRQIDKVDMRQGSNIRVQEEGTLVASSTMQTNWCSWGGDYPEEGEPFIVDCPFIYTIEYMDGPILFIGTMSNPGVK